MRHLRAPKLLRPLLMTRKEMTNLERRLAHLHRRNEGQSSARLTEGIELLNRPLVTHRLQTAEPKLGELSWTLAFARWKSNCIKWKRKFFEKWTETGVVSKKNSCASKT